MQGFSFAKGCFWSSMLLIMVIIGACRDSGGIMIPGEDNDNDGVFSCYGELSDGDCDCDDENANVYPGVEEVCDGFDNDCDGFVDERVVTHYCADFDGDGYVNHDDCDSACNIPSDYLASGDESGDDCNDYDSNINPAEMEWCYTNGVDDNCDGLVDILAFDAVALYRDFDDDGYGDPNVMIIDCPTKGYVEDRQDCDDLRNDVHPNADEPCDGPEPNVDFNCDQSLATQDNDGDGYRSCEECDDASVIRFPGNLEVCDGIDNDCDGGIPANEADNDADGFRICENDCDDMVNTIYPGADEEVADGVDQDCDKVDDCYEDLDGDDHGTATIITGIDLTCMNSGKSTLSDDCNDAEITVYTGAPELCDGLDNDCDTITPANEVDGDGDGYVECVSWTGSNLDIDGGDDCDDLVAENYPGNTEICDNIDNDCDGDIDDADSVVTGTTDWYLDDDGDKHGDDTATAVAFCVAPAKHVDNSDDCNDAEATVYTGAPELCDQLDNDCNLNVPANEADDDGDHYVECVSWVGSNSNIDGGDDCDDGEVNNYPGNTEICDNIDNDCDGDIDDDDSVVTGTTDWYPDDDGDKHGDDAASAVPACLAPANHVVSNDDCDDVEATVYTGATELCDGLDNDCDLNVPVNEADDDSDGYVECSDWVGTDVSIDGGDDCDDTTDTITDVFVLLHMDSDGDGYAVNDDSQDRCPGSHDSGYIDADIDGNGSFDADERDCRDDVYEVNPGALANEYTVWDRDCSGTDDKAGQVFSTLDGDFTFDTNVVNLFGDEEGDSTFQGVSTNWTWYVNKEDPLLEDLTATLSTATFSNHLSGVYDAIELPNPAGGQGTDNMCLISSPVNLSIGSRYGFCAEVESSPLDNQDLRLYTKTAYDSGLGVGFYMANLTIVAADEPHVCGSFVASSAVEQFVVCTGNWTTLAGKMTMPYIGVGN